MKNVEYTFTQTKNKKKRIIPIKYVTFEILNRVIKKREKQLGKHIEVRVP